jgi:hypothetical protein
MQEKENLLYILKQAKKAVADNDVVLLKELSNHTVHSASIYGDLDNIAVAVIVYSLGKLIERRKYTSYKQWGKFFKRYMRHIDLAISALEKNNQKKFQHNIYHIIQEINHLSGKFGSYIKDVFEKAKINKASRIYEHGVSMEKTAQLLGVSIWDLAEYAGQTGISDVNLSITKDIRDRIKIAQEAFS